MEGFKEWLKQIYGTDIDPQDLADTDFYELEDIYNGQFEVAEQFAEEVKNSEP